MTIYNNKTWNLILSVAFEGLKLYIYIRIDNGQQIGRWVCECVNVFVCCLSIKMVLMVTMWKFKRIILRLSDILWWILFVRAQLIIFCWFVEIERWGDKASLSWMAAHGKTLFYVESPTSPINDTTTHTHKKRRRNKWTST